MQPVNRLAIKNEAKGVLKLQFRELAVAFAIFLVANAFLGALIEMSGILFPLFIILELAVVSVVSVALYDMSLRALRGETVDSRDLTKFFPDTLKITLLTAAVVAITTIGFLLLVVPGIIATILLSQVYYVYLDDPKKDLVDILKASYELMKNRMGEYFMLMLSFIGWMIVTALTFGIAAIWVGPYVTLTYSAYYREISGGENRVATNANSHYYEPAAEQTPVVEEAVVVTEELIVEDAPLEEAPVTEIVEAIEEVEEEPSAE